MKLKRFMKKVHISILHCYTWVTGTSHIFFHRYCICNHNSFISLLVIKGFPQLQFAMISDLGIIKSFAIDGPMYETFPTFQLRKYKEFNCM